MTIAETQIEAATLSPVAKGLAWGLAAVAMWGTYLAFARAGVAAGLTPFDFVFLRYATAGLLMLPWLLRHSPATLGGVGWGRGAVLALFAGPVFIALGVGGYVFAPLAHGAVIQPATITLGTMIAAWALLGEKLGANRIFGAAIIVAGLALIATAKSGTAGAQAWIGDLLFIGAGLCWMTFTLLLRRWKIGAIPATAAVAVLSAAVVIPVFALFGTFDRLAALPLPLLMTQIVVQGALSGVVAVVAYGRSVEHLGAARAALFPALVPAAALIVGLPVTGEFPSIPEWSGAALATLGLCVAMGVVKVTLQSDRSAAG